MTHELSENIFLYHCVEQLISSYGTYFNKNIKDESMTIKEHSFLVRIRFSNTTTQKELVELFKVSDAYVAKLLRKFEEKEYVERMENPLNRREKLVKLTPKGNEKTDELIKIIENWQNEIKLKITEDESETLKTILLKLIK